jgi:hypothetical protein
MVDFYLKGEDAEHTTACSRSSFSSASLVPVNCTIWKRQYLQVETTSVLVGSKTVRLN